MGRGCDVWDGDAPVTFETLIEAFLDVYRKGSRPRYVHPHAAPHAAHLLRPHSLYGCPPDCDDPECQRQRSSLISSAGDEP